MWRVEFADEPGVVRIGVLPRAGVDGFWIVDATGLRGIVLCAGVVEAGRVVRVGGGESADSLLRGLRTGMADCTDTLLTVRGVGASF